MVRERVIIIFSRCLQLFLTLSVSERPLFVGVTRKLLHISGIVLLITRNSNLGLMSGVSAAAGEERDLFARSRQ